MCDALVKMLGDKLLSGKDSVATADALKGKTAVALYFSAHWCPPCRGFTPELAKMYNGAFKDKGLEIVFVSSDKDQGQFDDYFGEQPWLALPFDERATKAALSKKFKVQGIPTLVILDGATGETITTDGREAVSEDPKGENFPWKPPTFWDALGTEFLQGTEGDTVDVDELKGEGKVIGLYFSAHWCPPCRGFTPDLIAAYEKHLKGKKLEIVFVSSDRDQKSFLEYYGTMPWLAIPNGDKRKGMLSKLFGVQGIPSFVLVDAQTGATINGNARGKVSSDPEGKEFPWYPKPVTDLNDGPEGINETTSLCLMLEGVDAATQQAALAALEPIAAKSKKDGADTLFFYATGGATPVPEQIRKLTKVGTPTAAPVMLLIDIPDEGGFYVSPATEITADAITGFLDAYKAGALERLQLS